MNSIKAVIYDMDGIIIDSEPLWREAIIFTFNQVGLDFTEEKCRITQGMRLYEVVEYWHTKTPWTCKTIAEVEADLLKKITELISKKGTAMEGVNESLQYFKSKGFKIALASSSAPSLINIILKRLAIENEFEVINSAQNLSYGKPHPEIFIKTAQQLGIKPINCLVIEDSFHGILAAKSALMKVIAIPYQENWNDHRFSIADYQLKSLTELSSLNFE
ncbi:MAG: 2-deoxyglucose-6-phosphatase [Flavobacteriales bacterium CG_4_10_14_0_2_um_filter_32_8]|nr:MAG: 2-deoxyglucose-6-phosphatase [Flavobacteriales bacterium CG_4_10_14_0_2_um_filter_32_8]